MRAFCILALLLSGLAVSAQDTLVVEVVLCAPPRGTVQIALCGNEKCFKSGPGCVVRSVAADSPVVRVRLADIAPGTYAVKVFHDVNNNGQLDLNWLGVPNEPYGFSNDARGSFGPPPFQEASFQVGPKPLTIRITMKG